MADPKKPLPPEFIPRVPEYQIRNEEVEQTLTLLGRLLGDRMPEGFGFALLMFDVGERPDGDTGAMFYISSADKGDMIVAMKEFIKKQEH